MHGGWRQRSKSDKQPACNAPCRHAVHLLLVRLEQGGHLTGHLGRSATPELWKGRVEGAHGKAMGRQWERMGRNMGVGTQWECVGRQWERVGGQWERMGGNTWVGNGNAVGMSGNAWVGTRGNAWEDMETKREDLGTSGKAWECVGTRCGNAGVGTRGNVVGRHGNKWERGGNAWERGGDAVGTRWECGGNEWERGRVQGGRIHWRRSCAPLLADLQAAACAGCLWLGDGAPAPNRPATDAPAGERLHPPLVRSASALRDRTLASCAVATARPCSSSCVRSPSRSNSAG